MSTSGYKNLYDQSPVGLWRTTIEDGTFLHVNAAAAKIFGCPVEEMYTHHSTDFYDPAIRKNFIETLKSQRQILDYEIEIRQCDGNMLWVAVGAAINEKDGYIEGCIQDVTDKKNAEADQIKRHWEELEKITILQQNIKKKIEESEVLPYKSARSA